MEKTLLEKAKELKIQSRTVITEDVKELIMAYLKDEINSSQVRQVTNKDGVQFYSLVVMALRELIKDGRVKLD